NTAVTALEAGATGEVSLQSMQQFRDAVMTVSTWLGGAVTDVGAWAKNLDRDDSDFKGQAAYLIQHRLHNDTKWVDGLHHQLTAYHGKSMLDMLDRTSDALSKYIKGMSDAWQGTYPQLKTMLDDQLTYYVNSVSGYVDAAGLQVGTPNYQLDIVNFKYKFY